MDEEAEIMQRWGANQRCDHIVGQQKRASLFGYAILDCSADFAVTCVYKSSELPHDDSNLFAFL